MTEGVAIRSLDDQNREAAIHVLARAFRDNPLDRAVIGRGRDRRLRSITHGMRASVRTALAGGGHGLVAHIARDSSLAPVGVLIALPPDSFPLPQPLLLDHLRSLIGQGFRASVRWAEVYRALEVVHPAEPHWYLSLLGVNPHHQGCGIGSALLESWLDSIELDGLPSYLETDREENVRFYERVGFSVHVELQVLEANVWCMRRPSEPGS